MVRSDRIHGHLALMGIALGIEQITFVKELVAVAAERQRHLHSPPFLMLGCSTKGVKRGRIVYPGTDFFFHNQLLWSWAGTAV